MPILFLEVLGGNGNGIGSGNVNGMRLSGRNPISGREST
jgi:hypothetical protein